MSESLRIFEKQKGQEGWSPKMYPEDCQGPQGQPFIVRALGSLQRVGCPAGEVAGTLATTGDWERWWPREGREVEPRDGGGKGVGLWQLTEYER